MRIVSITGARPQFMKAAVISNSIRDYNLKNVARPIQEILIHTGQHYDYEMSQTFFEELDIPEPAVNLDIRSSLQGEMTGLMISALEKELNFHKPDCVLVYGDTNSTLAGALAASKLLIPIAHIEAGLRSFNRKMPEEINRIVVDNISDFLFCPSRKAVDQLLKEDISENVFLSGDVHYDSLLHSKSKVTPSDRKGPFALATIHRPENTDNTDRLQTIFLALKECAIPVVLPVHPRTQKELDKAGIKPGGSLEIINPLSYLSMMGHLTDCSFVITDSGGLQKEAYFSGKRCLIVRSETEWTELLDCGASMLVGGFESGAHLACEWALKPLEKNNEIYGNGTAGTFIVEKLVGLLK
ncbi:MAG: UDP-N-acetylglucosamine 2-epimerase (non-hydrolyzing) [Nitrospinae bacterium]|nr:UDP-N-acetylglucosamine 2-epimerase (non-hydrolyzing) [Nitrospinota bacterium]